MLPSARAEKMRMVRTKSSPETLTENLLREGETLTEDVRLSHENGENVRLSDENGEKREKGEDETLRVPQPEGNKGTVSNEGSQVSPLTFSHNPQVRLSDPHNSQVRLSGENDFSQVSHISQLSPQQLSQLGMFRDGKGDYFHFSNTEDGGYHLSPATQESVAAAVAGVQRQAQRAQSQQSDLMKKISENAVDQFQVNIQAIVRKVALSPSYTWGSNIYRSKLNTLHVHIFQ